MVLPYREAVRIAEYGRTGASLTTALVADIVADLFSCDWDLSAIKADFTRRHPETKTGTRATYKSQAFKAIEPLVADIRRLMPETLLATCDQAQFDAATLEAVAIVHNAMKVTNAARLGTAKVARERPRFAAPPVAVKPVGGDGAMTDPVMIAKAAIDAIVYHGGTNAAQMLAALTDYVSCASEIVSSAHEA